MPEKLASIIATSYQHTPDRKTNLLSALLLDIMIVEPKHRFQGLPTSFTRVGINENGLRSLTLTRTEKKEEAKEVTTMDHGHCEDPV